MMLWRCMQQPVGIVVTRRGCFISGLVRRHSSSSKMSAAEREAAIRDANEKMRQYHVNRPPLPLIYERKRAIGRQRDAQHHSIQLLVVTGFLVAFGGTVFLGRRIAIDDEFRKRYLPIWYDFTLPKPESLYTRAQMHEDLVQRQKELHERAIRGDFSPEKIQELRQAYLTELEDPEEEIDEDNDRLAAWQEEEQDGDKGTNERKAK
eukprot:CAMPEP_0116842642 /NCGR_PEP_ID=MMETSP0418-20121206/11633_1 /TAXON_ID=1158023 /ORGANISM="Astrosyne radiata, Strain 13vi08-1A" /LENGTH=205 /DNA_ID=CAMNT_0004473281 /DNA_START=75 /DNA_END=692 /DNA_ORIENTATION=+